MVDFSNIADLDVSKRKAWWTAPVPQLDPKPELECLHAGQTNKPFANALAAENAQRFLGSVVDADFLAENLNRDRKLFVKHVITGWRNVRDVKGKDVPFSEANLAEFLAKLPDWLMQRLSDFCASPYNFLPPNMPSKKQVAAKAGN